jgi:hypothetical protein
VEDEVALSAAAATSLVIALAYGYAGAMLARRPYAPEATRAGRMFALWWFGVAATAVASMASALLARAHASPALVNALDLASLAAHALALAGFLSYLGFLYLGTHVAERVVFPVYGALVLWCVAGAIVTPATGYHIEAWRPILDGPTPGVAPPMVLTAILLTLPVLGAIGAYTMLSLRVAEPAARRRARLTAGALLTWLAGAMLVSIPALGDVDAVQIAGRAIVLTSAATMVVATRAPAESRAASLDELEARVRQLI